MSQEPEQQVYQEQRTGASSAGLQRFLIIGCVGLVLLLGGLIWDAAMHSMDPGLVAHEGPLTMTNPSHLTAGLGVALTAIGIAGAVAKTGRRRGRPIAAIAVASIVVLGGGGAVWAQSSGHDDDEAHDESAAAEATSHTEDAPDAVHNAGHDDEPEGMAESEEGSATDDHAVASTDLDAMSSDDHDQEDGRDNGAESSLCPEAEGHSNHSGLVVHGETDTDITAEDCAAADAWFNQVTAATARFVDLDVALDEGYVAVDESVAIRHYSHAGYNRDGVLLDDDHPEGLVYYVGEGEPVLLGILFTGRGEGLEQPGGTLTQWHDHSSQGCPETTPDCGEFGGEPPQMLHAWVFEGAVDRFAHDFQSAAGENQTAIPARSSPRG